MMTRSTLYETNMLTSIFIIVLAHWNNSLWIDMSLFLLVHNEMKNLSRRPSKHHSFVNRNFGKSRGIPPKRNKSGKVWNQTWPSPFIIPDLTLWINLLTWKLSYWAETKCRMDLRMEWSYVLTWVKLNATTPPPPPP